MSLVQQVPSSPTTDIEEAAHCLLSLISQPENDQPLSILSPAEPSALACSGVRTSSASHHHSPSSSPVVSPSSSSSHLPATRKFSKEQTATLESHFSANPRCEPLLRAQLASELRMTERQVQVWFQNRRQSVNRSKEQQHQTTTIDVSSSSPLSFSSSMSITFSATPPSPSSSSPPLVVVSANEYPCASSSDFINSTTINQIHAPTLTQLLSHYPSLSAFSSPTTVLL